MSTEIALSDQIQKAKLLADSSILPESYRQKPSNLLWAMELADALDVSLAQAITGITVIQSKLRDVMGEREEARAAYLEVTEGPIVVHDGSEPFLDWDRVRNLGGLEWWRRRRQRSGDGDGDDAGTDEIEQEGVAVDRSREPVNWRAEAEAHRAAGRFRDSLRCRYRALVGDLARRGLIDEIPGRTTGEERAQLRVVRPESSDPFEAAADLFDEAWYGLVPVGAADDDRFQHLEHDVLERTRGRV